MAVVVRAARLMLIRGDLVPWERLLLLIGLGSIVYVAMIFWRGSEIVGEVRSLRRPTVTPVADLS
jgi:hypothetical protein